MNENSKNAAKEMFVGILVTVFGGIILAWLIGEGVFQQKPSTGEKIPITVVNDHCQVMDFYVDDQRVAAGLAPGQSSIFSILPGSHRTYSCYADTGRCGETLPANWPRTVDWHIRAGPECVITISVVNQNCAAMEIWVDEILAAAAVQPGATQSFQSILGDHTVRYCEVGTTTCSSPSAVTWTGPTDLAIEQRENCAVTVTLRNYHCDRVNLVVDEKDPPFPIEAESAREIEIAQGTHQVKTCTKNLKSCGPAQTVDWVQGSVFDIPRSPICP